jgi:hypothetical protein
VKRLLGHSDAEYLKVQASAHRCATPGHDRIYTLPNIVAAHREQLLLALHELQFDKIYKRGRIITKQVGVDAMN